MSVEEYIRAGGKHTNKDEEVGFEEIKATQAEKEAWVSVIPPEVPPDGPDLVNVVLILNVSHFSWGSLNVALTELESL